MSKPRLDSPELASGVLAAAAALPPVPRAPSLRRRLAAFTDEGVLLFGVLMAAGWIYSTITQQRHALQGKTGMQVFLFAVLGLYFIWFWIHGGQTVAMKAWHLRLVDAAGAPVGWARALARYVLSWLWFLPALAAVWVAGLQGPGVIYTALAMGVVCYALLVFLRADRQFIHDVLCGTRVIQSLPVQRPPEPAPGAAESSR